MDFNSLLASMSNYNDVDSNNMKVVVEKFNDRVTMTIIGDNRIGDMLAEVLTNVAKMQGAKKDLIKVVDNRDNKC